MVIAIIRVCLQLLIDDECEGGGCIKISGHLKRKI